MEASEVCTAKWETTAAHAFWASINNEMCICRKGKQTLKWEHCKEGPERGLSARGRPKVQHPGANRQRRNASVALRTGVRTPNLGRTWGLCALICYIWAPDICSQPSKAHLLCTADFLKSTHSRIKNTQFRMVVAFLKVAMPWGYPLAHQGLPGMLLWTGLQTETKSGELSYGWQVKLWLGSWDRCWNLINVACGQPSYVEWKNQAQVCIK